MQRDIFYTGVRDVECDFILKCLDEFLCPVYLEVGVNYGGTFIKILKWMKQNRMFAKAYGIDLFEDAVKEEQNFKIGWPNRTQTHDIGGNFGLNTATIDDLKKALNDEGYDNFELLKGYSDKVIPNIVGSKYIHVSFIDGNHTYEQTRLDFEKCFEKSCIGSCFTFHNTTKAEYQQFYKDGGPYKVCEELMEDDRVEYLGIAHTTKAFRRIK